MRRHRIATARLSRWEARLRIRHHHGQHHAPPPFTALARAPDRPIAVAASRKDAPLQRGHCPAQLLGLAAAQSPTGGPRSIVLSAPHPRRSATWRLPLSTSPATRGRSYRRATTGEGAAQDGQHRRISAASSTHRPLEPQQPALDELDSRWRHDGPAAGDCRQRRRACPEKQYAEVQSFERRRRAWAAAALAAVST
jgi:hypothetical protein